MASWGKPFRMKMGGKPTKSYYIYYYSGKNNSWKWLYRLPNPKYGEMERDLKLHSVSRAFEGR